MEVVCGVHFGALALLQAPYLGFFWEKIRKDFPRCHSVPPLTANAIAMPNNQPAQITVQLANMPELPRIWFIEENDTALVQVQQDRFLFNWKRTPDNDVEYPRYPKIVERFKLLFGQFEAFLKEYELGSISPIQLELTYINHITYGGEIGRLREIGKVFPDLSWRPEPPKRFLPEPEALNFRTSFPMPEGLLTIGLATAKRPDNADAFLRFDLAARGLPKDGEIWPWFDSANEWIVKAFVDITDETIQKTLWKRKT